jgi:hypothetical protein
MVGDCDEEREACAMQIPSIKKKKIAHNSLGKGICMHA